MKLEEIKLGEVLNVKRGTSLSGKYYDTKGTKIRLTLGNFNYPLGGFKNNTSKLNIYFNGPVKDEFILKKGDVITPLTEQVKGLLGETARIPKSDVYIQSGDIGLLIPDEKKLDKSYMYHLISSAIIKNQLSKGAQQTKIRHTSPDKIKDCVAWIPDLNIQQKVGSFLDDIDLKIANNNAISKELESMSKTIYDYWFLQFEFPDKDGKPYKSNGGKMVWNDQLKQEIPEGWEVGTLDQLFQITMGTSPKGDTLNQDANGIEFYQGSTDFGRFYPRARVYTTKPIKMVKSREVLLSVRAPVGAMNFSQNDCCIGRGLAGIHYDVSPIFAWNKLKSMQNYFDIFNNNGTTFGSLTSEMLNKLVVIIPDINVIKLYAKKTNVIEQQIKINHSENQQLKSLRGFLLPLLMNSQVKISD
ncbi:restriction endonuclease subunit S [Lactobacillus kefiranofaciens subsp. kefirgranum]|uniref:restriction endonuclease subunit S n=1 Tax=Lactobacillus kefiranofaciens TaxID=267818 RepID=UPI00202DE611|nr:restriction endonuclease subunit S [Lactobacillus kefiranofaciens]URW71099.1 restriction endonuclease subunit S [Lactobacillus kefiranofaciens subsp. kefirgranum]URW73046.1 restriction endonuclease subunit S [Lactobacillus kefiranofaciens subsp. kefirgranum]